MRRLIEHILALPDDALASATMQDMAICQVWLSNRGAEIDDIPGHEALPTLLRKWLAAAASQPPRSEARRNQTLLRELIARGNAGVGEMARDELDLLETVYAFAHACQDTGAFQRILRAIEPRRARIAERRAALEPARGVPALAARLLVVSPEDILRAPTREIRTLAGVELPARGPVLMHTGHLRVLGDVPDGTTVVAEEADCVVDGFVLGRVAVSGHCEILDNVSGVVISRNGDVRTRNIVDGAFVVAKRGRVVCRRVQGARVVFAGDSITVSETSARGRLLSPVVQIGQALESGQVVTSERVTSERIGGGESLDIYLRRGLSCLDYGEKIERSISKDVSQALHARADLHCARDQIAAALRSAEQTAQTCLMYLLAGEEASHTTAEIVSAQRRLDVLNRIVTGLRSVYAQAEAPAEGEQEDRDATPRQKLWEKIDADIEAMIGEMPEDDTVRKSYDELMAARGKLRERNNKDAMIELTLGETAEKLERWRKEARSLRAIIDAGHAALGRSNRMRDLLGTEADSRSKILTLQRVLARARTEPPNSPLRVRSESPFIAVSMRSIEKRLNDGKKLKSDAEALRREFESARRLVWTHYQMRIDEDVGVERRIVVEGRFERGVRLYAVPSYLAETSRRPPAHPFTPLPSDEQPVRYVCVRATISEEPLDAIPEFDAEPGFETALI